MFYLFIQSLKGIAAQSRKFVDPFKTILETSFETLWNFMRPSIYWFIYILMQDPFEMFQYPINSATWPRRSRCVLGCHWICLNSNWIVFPLISVTLLLLTIFIFLDLDTSSLYYFIPCFYKDQVKVLLLPLTLDRKWK